jgi:predicted transcriptional regulator
VLKRHLQTDHRTTTAEYRQRFALPRDYPLVAPDYSAIRSKMATKIGLGRAPARKNLRNRKSA